MRSESLLKHSHHRLLWPDAQLGTPLTAEEIPV